METATRAPGTVAKARYIPRGRNQLHTIFERHLEEFCDVYDERYAAKYGMFRLDHIRDICGRFLTCGDYRLGVARIRCTNPACGHDYFRPFSCKGFYLCPSCSQKRTLLFAEHLTSEVLLDIPHRQFVFTMPKALRPFFRHDRRLFAEVSRLIYTIISEFYAAAASKPLLTGVVTAFQSFGDQLRWNAHFHSLVIEGGFDEAGRFIHIPLSNLRQMTCRSRARLLRQFGSGRTAKCFAGGPSGCWWRRNSSLRTSRRISCRHDSCRARTSGFSIDNSVRLTDAKSKESLAEYIARPPLSLKKIRYEPFKGKVLFHTNVL